MPQARYLVSGFRSSESNRRSAEANLAGNFRVGTERIGGRDGNTDREESKVDDRDFERRLTENESSITFRKACGALNGGGQGFDLPDEQRIREAVVGRSIDKNSGGFKRRIRGGAEEGEGVVGEGERSVLRRKGCRRPEAMEGLGRRAEPAIGIDPVGRPHFSH